MEGMPTGSSNETKEKELHPVHEKLATPEKAAEIAEELKGKIELLKSVNSRANESGVLSEEDVALVKQTNLFGDRDFKRSDIGWAISVLESKQYQFLTAGPDGARHVEIQYPTGAFHKVSDFEKSMQDRKADVQDLYHDLGTSIDRAYEGIAADYNKTVAPSERIGFANENDPHAQNWFSPSYFESESEGKGFRFAFGNGSTAFTLKKVGNEWTVLSEDKGVSMLPRKVIDALKAETELAAKTLERNANRHLV